MPMGISKTKTDSTYLTIITTQQLHLASAFSSNYPCNLGTSVHIGISVKVSINEINFPRLNLDIKNINVN